MYVHNCRCFLSDRSGLGTLPSLPKVENSQNFMMFFDFACSIFLWYTANLTLFAKNLKKLESKKLRNDLLLRSVQFENNMGLDLSLLSFHECDIYVTIVKIFGWVYPLSKLPVLKVDRENSVEIKVDPDPALVLDHLKNLSKPPCHNSLVLFLFLLDSSLLFD